MTNDPDFMQIYNKARAVPEEAKKPITAGRLKGMTDINPMYRIKTLTEIFGPCGSGWWYEITNKQIIDDQITNQRAAFVDILLYYIDPFSGEPSQGIPGTGGLWYNDLGWRFIVRFPLPVSRRSRPPARGRASTSTPHQMRGRAFTLHSTDTFSWSCPRRQ